MAIKKDIILVNLNSLAFNPREICNLGLAAIEPYLKRNGISCDVISLHEVDSYLEQSEVFGVSVLDYTYVAARKLAKKLKDKTVIWGGWTATSIPELILKNIPEVDYVILREGEKRLSNLLKSFNQPEIFNDIDGIAYRQEDNKITVRPPTDLLNLDDLPIAGKLAAMNDIVFVEMSRGCYGRCKYCQEVFKMRFKNAKRIADEIEHWYDKGYKRFYIGNANSLVNGKLLKELLSEIETRKLFITAYFVGRPDDVLRNLHILEAYFKSKVIDLEALEIGIEANTQHLLDLIGRKTTPLINKQAMESLNDLKKRYSSNTRIHANFILFSHYDMTMDDFIENVRFLGDFNSSRDTMSLNLYGISNTPIWKDMKKRGFKEQNIVGMQISDYPFTDKQVDRLFNTLVRKPLAKIINTGSRKQHFNFQQQCHDKALEFYHSPNILNSIMDFIEGA